MSSPPASITSYNTNNKGPSDTQIRAKLLNKLGIYDAPPSVKNNSQPMTAAQHRRLRILRGMGLGHTLHPSPPDGSAARNPLEGMKTFHEPLKVDSALSTTTEFGKQQQQHQHPTKKTTRIAFQEDVEVMPIPTRYEYSDRIKSRIWSNRHELQENAERNAIEFASEGWNWQTVTEDDGMYICSQSGELVHPIHLQHLVDEESTNEPQQTTTQEQQQHPLERGQPVHSG